jgi:hypothetical protein
MLASAATFLRDIRREPIRCEAVLASGTCVGKMLENKAVVANASNHDRWGDRSASSGCRRGCEMKLWLEASIATVPSCPLAVALLASVVPLPTTALSGASDDAAAADSDAVAEPDACSDADVNPDA